MKNNNKLGNLLCTI